MYKLLARFLEAERSLTIEGTLTLECSAKRKHEKNYRKSNKDFSANQLRRRCQTVVVATHEKESALLSAFVSRNTIALILHFCATHQRASDAENEGRKLLLTQWLWQQEEASRAAVGNVASFFRRFWDGCVSYLGRFFVRSMMTVTLFFQHEMMLHIQAEVLAKRRRRENKKFSVCDLHYCGDLEEEL